MIRVIVASLIAMMVLGLSAGGDAAAQSETRGIGAEGITATDAPADTAASGIGGSGVTPATQAEAQGDDAWTGIGAAGTTRTATVNTMTAMPSTGVGPVVAGSWAAAAALLGGAVLFGALAAARARGVHAG